MDDLFDQLDSATSGKPVDLPPRKPDDNGLFTQLDLATGGRPEWKDERYTKQSRAADIMQTHVLAGKSWDEASGAIRENIGVDPSAAKPDYRMAEERQKASTLAEPEAMKWAMRIPGSGTYLSWKMAHDYGEAKDRIEKGQAKDEPGESVYDSDYRYVAHYERLQQIKANESTGQALMRAGGQLPAFVLESMAGGRLLGAAKAGIYGGEAVQAANAARAAQPLLGRTISNAAQGVMATPFVPALYAEQGAQRLNNAKDKDSFLEQSKAYGEALTVGAIQNAVLGTISGAAKPGGTLIGSIAKRTSGGVLEQQVADVVTSAAGLTDGYGLAGDLNAAVKSDKYDDAFKHATVQVMTFAAFAALHGRPKDGENVLKSYSDALKDGAKDEKTPTQAANDWIEANASKAYDPSYSITGAAPKKIPGMPAEPQRITKPGGGEAMKEPVDDALAEKRVADAHADDVYKDALRSGKSIDEAKDAASKAFEEKLGIKRPEPPPEPPEPSKTAPPVAETPSGRPETPVAAPDPAEAKIGPMATNKRQTQLNSLREQALGNKRLQTLIRGAETGEMSDPQKIFDAAGLNEKERHVIAERLTRTHGEIGQDDEMGGVSRQRVKQIEEEALAKLGRRAEESLNDAADNEKLQRAIAAFERGGAVDANELRHDPAEVRRVGKERLPLVDEVDKKVGKLLDEMEKLDAAGKLTPQLEEKYRTQINRLGASLEASSGKAQGPTRKAQPVPGGVEPSPVRGKIGSRVQGGDSATPPVAPPEGTRTAAQPAAARLAETGRPDAEGPTAGTPAAPGGGEAAGGELNRPVDQSDLPPTHNPPGAPVPGVTRGANASTPLTQSAIDGAILRGAKGDSDRVGMGAAPAGFGGGVSATSTSAPIRSGAAAVWNWAGIQARYLRGEIAPRKSALDVNAGDKTGQLAAVPDNQARTTQYFNQQLLDHLTARAAVQVDAELKSGGSDLKPTRQQVEQTALYNGDKSMSAMMEERLRMERAHNMTIERMELERMARSSDPKVRMDARAKATAAKEAADEVGTMVGSKFADEKDFQNWLKGDEYKAFREWWDKSGLHDKFEELYRKSQGMDPDAEIQSRNQLPRGVFQMKAVREGESLDDVNRVMGGTRKGNLLNARMNKLGAAQGFTGSAAAYDTNPFRVIEFTFAGRMRNAAMAEMYRSDLKAKTPDGKPVAYAKLPGSDLFEGYKIMTTKNLPPDIKSGYPAGTEINLAYHPEAYGETLRALELSSMDHLLGDFSGNKIGRFVKKLFALPTAINLVGIAEGTSHCIAQASIALARGGIRSLPDMVRNIHQSMMRSPEAVKELMEGSAHGWTKGQHAEWSLDESGFIGGKYDPTKYIARAQQATIGKFMDRFDDAMRLTMSHAFDRIAEAYPGVIKSEQNKRDFINQLGNYQRTTQHWGVALFRDLGIGPFATAATNNVAQSVRTLALGRGLRTSDYATQVKLRAELGLQVAGVLGATALINYLVHKRVDGDDNTPLGGLKLPGNNGYVDMAALANLRRGSKTIGLQSLIEGNRYGGKGAESGTIGSNWEEEALQTVVHPAAGPGVNFARSAAVGKDAIGRETVDRKYQHDMWAKLQGALLTENPLMEMIAKLSGVKTHPGKPEETTQTVERGLGLGSILKKSNHPPGKPLPTQ